MPTYQYVCTECGEPLEVVQKFSDDALTECPACGGRLRKVFSAAGIIFKGSGFYRTDSRNGSGKAAAAANGSSNGKAESKPESKSESKPEKAAESKSAKSESSAGSSASSSASKVA